MANLIIAANDSPAGVEDYRCDTVNDHIEIKAAIAQIEASGGGKLLFRQGNYYPNVNTQADIIEIPSNVTLEGESPYRERVRLNFVGNPTYSGAVAIMSKGWQYVWPPPYTSNIAIKNMTIDAGLPTGKLRTWYGEFGQGYYSNLLCFTTNGLLFDNVEVFHNFPSSPKGCVGQIILNHCDNVTVQSCRLDGFSLNAQADGYTNYPPVPDKRILMNTGYFVCQDTTIINFQRLGLYVNMLNVTVRRNTIENGLYTALDAGFSTHALYELNKIRNVAHMGIYTECGEDVLFRKNDIQGITYHYAGGGDGYAIRASDIQYRQLQYPNIRFEENYVRGAGQGVLVNGVRGVSIINNDMADLERHGIAIQYYVGSAGFGTAPLFADGCTVTGNKFINFGRNYTWAHGCIIMDGINNVVDNNEFDGGGNAGAIYGVREFFTKDKGWTNAERPNFNIIGCNKVSGVSIKPYYIIGPQTTQTKYNLTKQISGQGTTVPAPGVTAYNCGSVIAITAAPAQGWKFDHWEGAASGSELKASVEMTSDKQITAVFTEVVVPPTKAIITISVTGSGTTDPASGSWEVDIGGYIDITASAPEGWVFSHWEGSISGTSAAVHVGPITGDMTIVAVFEEAEVPPKPPLSTGVIVGAGIAIAAVLLALSKRKKGA